jgi:hypothetical protein
LFSGNLKLLELFSVRHVVTSAGSGIEDVVPGFADRYEKVRESVTASTGGSLDVYTAVDPTPYGLVVPAAVRLTDEQAINTILNPEFPPDQLLILSPESDVDLATLSELPPPLESRVEFESWSPGAMRMRILPPASEDAYVVVSENWYPDWKANVDGLEAEVMRGNMTLITVPVSAGAEVVEVSFESADYKLGKLVTLLSLALVVLAIALPRFVRSRVDG